MGARIEEAVLAGIAAVIMIAVGFWLLSWHVVAGLMVIGSGGFTLGFALARFDSWRVGR